MPCHAALSEKFLALPADQDIETALKTLKKKKLEVAAVVDEEGRLLGSFGIRTLLKNTLPVSIAVGGDFMMDVKVPAAPGLAKRLSKVYPLPVEELMERKVNVVFPETPIWEAVNFLTQSNDPLFIIDQKSHKPLGIIDLQSALDELNRLKDSEQ